MNGVRVDNQVAAIIFRSPLIIGIDEPCMAKKWRLLTYDALISSSVHILSSVHALSSVVKKGVFSIYILGWSII